MCWGLWPTVRGLRSCTASTRIIIRRRKPNKPVRRTTCPVGTILSPVFSTVRVFSTGQVGRWAASLRRAHPDLSAGSPFQMNGGSAGFKRDVFSHPNHLYAYARSNALCVQVLEECGVTLENAGHSNAIAAE